LSINDVFFCKSFLCLEKNIKSCKRNVARILNPPNKTAENFYKQPLEFYVLRIYEQPP
jgi:hypothetical protein